ncbi:MAG: VWA domain-containing protein, partial [bacterium]|nr:VWA domain-containing protein [bacterium]
MSPIIPFLIIFPLVILLTVRAALANTYHSPAAATLLSAFRGAAIIIIAVLSLWWSWERPLRDTRPVSALILVDEASGNSAESERIARKLRTVVNARNGRTLSATYNRVAGNKPGGNGLAGAGPDGTGRALGSYNSFEAALPIVRWLMKVNPDISIAVISDVLPEELHGPEFAGINLSWNQAKGASRNHPIKDVIYPGVIFANQVFRIQVRIAPGPRQQELVLSVNNSRIESRPLSGSVSPGDIVIFDLALKTPGIHSVELTVLDRDESIIGQHRLPIRALQEPDIFYYSPMGNNAPLAGYLDRSGMVIHSLSIRDLISGALPEPGVSGRDSLLILDSAPASYFNRRLVSSLSDVVLRKGYKLLILPGSDISPRDRGAAIENILPVKFGLEENDDPGTDLAFVAVVDTSLSMFFNIKGVSTFARSRGSEGGLTTKIDMAKKAIMNLAGAIKESDRMGVLTVTDRPSWIIKPSQPRNVEEEAEQIRRISAFGPGINLYSGLFAAYQELAALNSDLKHILVFLDTADVDEYQVADRGTVWELLEEMKEQGITVSLIGFGKAGDPHIPQLNRFAEESGGYFYLTSDIEEIPGFGLMDLEQVADSLLNFQARKVDFFSSDFPGIDSFPDLNGQVITTLKPGASLYAWSDRDLPLFATWPFGTGKVGVFTA